MTPRFKCLPCGSVMVLMADSLTSNDVVRYYQCPTETCDNFATFGVHTTAARHAILRYQRAIAYLVANS